MDIDLERFNTVPPETEPGMNLISADFDLIMVNRVNERLYGKPMVELLGKKCYREFEKREEPCPHCPGRLSLISGESHAAETEGLRDDGTWFSARVRTHPVQGPGDQPTGFIEVVEDITEEKRAEKLARIDDDLQTALTAADTVRKALLHCLDAALKVEGIDAASVFSIDWAKRQLTLVCQRNLPPGYVAALAEAGLDSAMSGELPAHLARVPGAPRASELIPVVHRGQRAAVLVAGAYVYPAIPPSLRAGLHGLGATAGHAISRILAERSRGDAVADLEAFITIAPIATWLLDSEGRVTMWNRAAERLLGWEGADVLGRRPPFLPQEGLGPISRDGTQYEVTLLSKTGSPVDVRLTLAPFRDVVGNASASIVMAEDLSVQSQPATSETASNPTAAGQQLPPQQRPATSQPTTGDDLDAPNTARPLTLLVLDPDPVRNCETVQAVSACGWEASGFSRLEEVGDSPLLGEGGCRDFAAAFVELIANDGSSGLEVKSSLRDLGMNGPVIVCSDADVLGYQFHGFAAALKRPYSLDDLKAAIQTALSNLRK